MNKNWKDFLLANNLVTDLSKRQFFAACCASIYPLTHLSVLAVTGSDARKFLQGQISCNINNVTQNHAGFGAFCNAKGRVISTFFILQHEQQLLLILPTALLASLQKRLQMYILRADTQLQDKSNKYCLLGLQAEIGLDLDLPDTAMQTQAIVGGLACKYPVGNYWLWVGNIERAQEYWLKMNAKHFVSGQQTQAGQLHNIYAGIPWLTNETSGMFIPQSINMVQLEGICFNKGCYIGQEIIARTHYLGKSKNIMLRAQLSADSSVIAGAKIYNLDADNKQSVGNIVNAQINGNNYEVLMSIKTGLGKAPNLSIENTSTPITIL